MLTKTTLPRPEQVPINWLLIDAKNKVLGRLAGQVATLLLGKHKPQYTRHLGLGDQVIVVNVDKIRVTGQKSEQKIYYHYTGYPGGLRAIALGKLRQNNPEKMLQDAVWGMLPKSRLGRRLFSHLHVYRGSEHPHQAQKPESKEKDGK